MIWVCSLRRGLRNCGVYLGLFLESYPYYKESPYPQEIEGVVFSLSLQVVTPSRDVRAQFYSRMGLVAATVPQPSQSATEEQVVIPSCSSSAEDEEVSRQRAKLAKDKDLETTKRRYGSTSRIANDYEGR